MQKDKYFVVPSKSLVSVSADNDAVCGPVPFIVIARIDTEYFEPRDKSANRQIIKKQEK